jgi:putative sterol carrier protein
MGVFTDTDQFYGLFHIFLDRVFRNEKIGKKLAATGLKIQFQYFDPHATITIHCGDPDAPEGTFGTFEFGDDASITPEVIMKQSADFSNRFWQGKENAITAIAKRKITAKGNVPKALKLIPAIRPTFRIYKKVLIELELDHLLVGKK